MFFINTKCFVFEGGIVIQLRAKHLSDIVPIFTRTYTLNLYLFTCLRSRHLPLYIFMRCKEGFTYRLPSFVPTSSEGKHGSRVSIKGYLGIYNVLVFFLFTYRPKGICIKFLYTDTLQSCFDC